MAGQQLLCLAVFRDYGRSLKGRDVVSWRMGTEREENLIERK